MPNTKTGTTWAPDIRPESIETFTETYTSEEQTVTYKRVADHPILNGIQDKLAFFMTHAGAVWYNKLANRTVADEIRELKSKKETMQKEIDDLKASKMDLTTVSISTLPDTTQKNSFFFIVGGASDNKTGLQNYARGIYITSGNADGAVIAVGIEGKISFSFRNNGTWTAVKTLG